MALDVSALVGETVQLSPSVPLLVIGDPLTVKSEAGADSPTLVTVPPPPPPDAAVVCLLPSGKMTPLPVPLKLRFPLIVWPALNVFADANCGTLLVSRF